MTCRSNWLAVVGRVAVVSCWLRFGSPSHAADWPQWRGPHGDSTSDETGLPLRWSDDAGIVWKAKLPAWGTSTPAIWGDAVFVTTQQDEKLLLLKLSKRSGEVEWTREVGGGVANRKEAAKKGASSRSAQKFHDLHNMASPSPVTDGRRMIAHFGNGDLAAYDFAGKQLWKRNLQQDHGSYTIWWGHANSPVVHRDLVISVCMQDSLVDLGADPVPSYVVAHDLNSGELRWKTMRMTNAKAEECDSYTTPIFHESAGRVEMILVGGDQVDAYDPATGQQLWFLPGLAKSRIITGPAIGHGMVFLTQGMRGPMHAVKLGGRGKLTADASVWKHDQSTPDSPCPVVAGDLLFTVTDNGIAQCFDARTGKLHWRERIAGDYKASPLAADGRIYFLNTRGLTTVITAQPQFEKLAENQLSTETLASFAVSDGRIFVRGRDAMYCLGTSNAR
jgi:outer membrane protein assembly factor BamB